MSDIICKNYNENDCKRLNPNCKWAGKRGCIRRDGVLGGTRYRYNARGEAVVLENNPNEPGLVIAPEPVNSTFEFVYSPENSEEIPVITRRFISSGTFGAAFVPAFPCSNGQMYNKYIGKVFFSSRDADKEWNITQLLKRVEAGTSQKYFTYPKYQCKIDFKCPANGTSEEQLSRAEMRLFNVFNEKIVALITGPIKYPAQLTQHIMEYSGYTLSTYINKYYKTEHSLSRAEFIHILENLFYAIKRLNDLGYVHQDIKPQNIVLTNTKRLRVIDFGLTISVDDYSDKTKNMMLRVAYHRVSPPENYLYNALYRDKNIKYTSLLDTIWEGYDFGKEWYKELESPTNNIETDRFIQTLLSIQENLNVVDRTKALSNFWKENRLAYKSDTYSIGTAIHRILADGLYLDNGSNVDLLIPSDDDNPEAVELFKRLMSGILAINPLHRLDINEAIVLVKQIKKIPHEDPFKINVDSQQVKDIFLQFGNNLHSVNKDISYLRK
jgi:serine/threonine protein kinase